MRTCKYCNSEMDLMDAEINYWVYVCMNEQCNAVLTIDERYDEEQWEKE